MEGLNGVKEGVVEGSNEGKKEVAEGSKRGSDDKEVVSQAYGLLEVILGSEKDGGEPSSDGT